MFAQKVSVVGARGVGKSTVCSLLSGNASMFVVGSGSVGTTTTGADISTIIPTKEYSATLSDKLEQPITMPNVCLPLFLIDSEGMGVRGDEFDFMTTSPPAIIAKDIIWIGSENLETAKVTWFCAKKQTIPFIYFFQIKVLYEIQDYLNGLDNIAFNKMMSKDEDTFCEQALYGNFIVVINKMMGDASDERLQLELLTPEPDCYGKKLHLILCNSC